MLPLLLAYLSLIPLSDPLLVFTKPGEELPLMRSMPVGTQLEAQWNSGLIRQFDTLTAPMEGRHYLALFSRDSLGSISEPTWYLIQVDNQPPLLKYDFSSAFFDAKLQTWWVHPNAELQFSASDEGSGVRETKVSRDGGPAQHFDSETFAFTLSNSERVKLLAQTVDRVGNMSQALTLQIVEDGTPPQHQVHFRGPHSALDNRMILGVDASLHITGSDEESGLEALDLSLNGEKVSLEALQRPWQPGSYQLSVVLKDRVGNVARPSEMSLFVDHSPPEPTWQVAEPARVVANPRGETFYQFPMTITLTATDEVFGPYKLHYFHPEQGWLPADQSVSLTLPALKVKTRDLLGNEMQKVFTWNTDLNPPAIQLKNASGQELEPTQMVAIHFGDEIFPQVMDAEAGLKTTAYRLDEGPMVALPNVFRFTQKDQFTLTIIATDVFGNTAQKQWKIAVKRSQRGTQP